MGNRKKDDAVSDFRGIKQTAQHRKLLLASTDTTYDFNTPAVAPQSSPFTTPSISQLETTYWINPLAHKAINLRANRVIGDGFELEVAEGKNVDPIMAQKAKELCDEFHRSINYKTFYRQAIINAYVAGNEWTELIRNKLETVVNLNHGDFTTIDFRRDFINNKILLGSDGKPEGYWQYIQDLSQLYRTLSLLYGSIGSWKNLQAAKNRLKESQSLNIEDEKGNVVAMVTTKPNYMFLRKDEIVHLSFNNLNDNLYGVSMILPAYDAITQLNSISFAIGEMFNTIGYPKPIIYVGDENHPPTQAMYEQAADAVLDPVRKESFVLPYFSKMEYLVNPTTSDANNYPEWFVTQACIGLRTPKELLTGEGEANRATSMQGSSDWEKDCEEDRSMFEEYVYQILDLYLKSKGYMDSNGGRSIYLPKITWPKMVVEDEVQRQKMTLDLFDRGLITKNQVLEELKKPVANDGSGGLYSYQMHATAQPGINAESGFPPTNSYNQTTFEAKHALAPKAELNPVLNKRYGTDGVDYKKIAQENMTHKVKSVSPAVAKKIRDVIVNGVAAKKSAKQLFEEVKALGNYEDWEAERIIYTEYRMLVENAKLEDAKNKGLKTKKWVSKLDEDTSPICKALNGKVVQTNKPFTVMYKDKNGKVKRWKGDVPPAHPNCRSVVEYQEGNK